MHVIRAWWRRRPPRVRWLASAALLGVIPLLVLAVVWLRLDPDPTVMSLVVAVVFGTVAVVQNRRMERRQHTVELVGALQVADTLAAADQWMAMRISRGQAVTGDVAPEDDRYVITLLDYYEFLALLGQRGQLDARLLVELRGPAMRAALELCDEYIASRRGAIGEGLYSHVEALIAESGV